MLRVLVFALVLLGALSGVAIGPVGPALAATAPPTSGQGIQADFNGDGFVDLAVGVPFEDFFAVNDGAVNVIYGSAGGLTAANNDVWSQNSPGVLGVAEAGDLFGYSLAAADYNGDGFTDLAIGVPDEDQAATNDGAVNILYGSANGLTATGNQVWSQDSTGIADIAEAGDRFGYSLATGDFTGNGIADLAVGVPFEDQGATDTGVVNVIIGRPGGLTADSTQLWSQNSTGIADTAEAGDRFGYSLATGDFTGNGIADLAVGVPFEDQGATDTGVVNVIIGRPGGLTADSTQLWSQNSTGIADTAETGDRFGYSLATGDFTGNGIADLAVGVPFEDQGATDTGVVNVIIGRPGGLTADSTQLWSQNSTGIADTAETGDRFGYSLATGDFTGNGIADLAVGVPFEDQGATDTGVVNVIIGRPGGLTADSTQLWSQNSTGIADTAETGDRFGYSLATGDFTGNGIADLAVGVPAEDQEATNDGAVNAIYGLLGGLSSARNQIWSQNSPGIGGVGETGDQFGTALTTRHH